MRAAAAAPHLARYRHSPGITARAARIFHSQRGLTPTPNLSRRFAAGFAPAARLALTKAANHCGVEASSIRLRSVNTSRNYASFTMEFHLRGISGRPRPPHLSRLFPRAK